MVDDKINDMLAAIIAANMAGYSRLTDADEQNMPALLMCAGGRAMSRASVIARLLFRARPAWADF